jgi:group I intron endonuclease
MLIYKALLEYGYSKFSLEILEYCTPEKCIEREQYYINLLKPKYNILKTAGSTLGYKHTKETLAKMSVAKKGKNHPLYGKKISEEHLAKLRNRKLSKKTKALISAARLGKSYLSESAKAKMSKESVTAKAVKVIDLETNETSLYTSIKKAANVIGVTQPLLSKRLKKNQGPITVKKRYQVEKVNLEK